MKKVSFAVQPLSCFEFCQASRGLSPMTDDPLSCVLLGDQCCADITEDTSTNRGDSHVTERSLLHDLPLTKTLLHNCMTLLYPRFGMSEGSVSLRGSTVFIPGNGHLH